MDLDVGGVLSGAPNWVHWIVWAAIVAFCVGFVLRFLSPIGKAATKILIELSPDNGKSIKDQVDLSVQQNVLALAKIDSIDQRLTGEINQLRADAKVSDEKRDEVAHQVQRLQGQFTLFAQNNAAMHNAAMHNAKSLT